MRLLDQLLLLRRLLLRLLDQLLLLQKLLLQDLPIVILEEIVERQTGRVLRPGVARHMRRLC